jgi:hypothetical protein
VLFHLLLFAVGDEQGQRQKHVSAKAVQVILWWGGKGKNRGAHVFSAHLCSIFEFKRSRAVWNVFKALWRGDTDSTYETLGGLDKQVKEIQRV